MQKTMITGMSKAVITSKTRLAMALARTLPKMVSSARHRNILVGRVSWQQPELLQEHGLY